MVRGCRKIHSDLLNGLHHLSLRIFFYSSELFNNFLDSTLGGTNEFLSFHYF